MTDEHTILTASGVGKARAVHRKPREEKFVATELKKVRGFPWNGASESLQAPIVTQQDLGPSGHGLAYLTSRVLFEFGATLGCSGCVDLGHHTEACRARLDWTNWRACCSAPSVPAPAQGRAGRLASRWEVRSRTDQRYKQSRQSLYRAYPPGRTQKIGGLFVIVGINVVATLVPEEDVWQFGATKMGTTEIQLLDGDQNTNVEADYD